MPTKKNAALWKHRKKRTRKFKDPEALWLACVKYFTFVEENPLYERKYFSVGGELKYRDVEKMRAMTIGAMCVFIGTTHETWCQWRKPDNMMSGVVAEVDAVIRSQKFEGAAAGFLKESLIARELGLAETTRVETQPSTDMTPWSHIQASIDE